jgi:hypothetical protein
MEKEKKIVNFTDLKIWQKAHKLMLTIYEIIKKFPKEKMFQLSNQTRKIRISVNFNPNEGFERSFFSGFELPTFKAAITIYALVLGMVALILVSGIIGFIIFELNLIEKRTASNKAFDIAEAGIEYYKWCINNAINCDLEKDYTDINGTAIGKFKIEIQTNSNCNQIISHEIVSTGWTYKFPEITKKISVLYARESVAKYAYVLNSNVWVGSDHVIRGPYHSNGGIRFDGTNVSTVTSAQENWECTNSFGCGPEGVGYGQGLCPSECQIRNHRCICPGTFSTTRNSNRDLFSYPIPQFDFVGITADLSQIKNAAQNLGGIYLPPSNQINPQGRGWHLRFFVDANEQAKVEARIITALSATCAYSLEDDGFPSCGNSVDGYYQWNYFNITSEYIYQTYNVPDSCSAIFVEDNLWPEGTIKGKVVLASANLIDTNKDTDVILNYSLQYAGSGNDGLTLIGERNIFVGPNSPNNMTLNGIFIAQKGRFSRNHYQNNIKESLTIKGSIISSGRVGTQWINLGGHIMSGYINRETYVDQNLLYNPPVFTPYLSSQFKKARWEEK